jgi:hypothetical protein
MNGMCIPNPHEKPKPLATDAQCFELTEVGSEAKVASVVRSLLERLNLFKQEEIAKVVAALDGSGVEDAQRIYIVIWNGDLNNFSFQLRHEFASGYKNGQVFTENLKSSIGFLSILGSFHDDDNPRCVAIIRDLRELR